MANGNRDSRLPEVIGAGGEGSLFLLSQDGRITGSNRAAEQALGYAQYEIIGRHVSCLYPDEDIQAGLPDHLLALAVKDGNAEIDGWRVRKDGSRVWAPVGGRCHADRASGQGTKHSKRE